MSSAQKGRIILLITLLVLYEGTMALKNTWGKAREQEICFCEHKQSRQYILSG